MRTVAGRMRRILDRPREKAISVSALFFAVSLALVILIAIPEVTAFIVSALFPLEREPIYPRAPLRTLLGEHIFLSGISSLIAVGIGMTAGILVTRRAGRPFLRVLEDAGSLMQTIPPVAVLALAVPVLGFGTKPALTALIFFSVLPVIRNTIAGLGSVPAAVHESARGMGMTGFQVLSRIELPLASRVIIAGIRISIIINIGTATIGAVVGAGGLGAPIVSGLSRGNVAFVFQGALPAALLAACADRLFALIELILSGDAGDEGD